MREIHECITRRFRVPESQFERKTSFQTRLTPPGDVQPITTGCEPCPRITHLPDRPLRPARPITSPRLHFPRVGHHKTLVILRFPAISRHFLAPSVQHLFGSGFPTADGVAAVPTVPTFCRKPVTATLSPMPIAHKTRANTACLHQVHLFFSGILEGNEHPSIKSISSLQYPQP